MKVRRIAPKQQYSTKRVAAYARVSTLKYEQEESYETQVAYYNQLISGNADWINAGIYSDHGFSGVCAEKRPGFMKMIEEAKAGRIDMILVKAISRFARNAIEAQEYVKLLKELNVEVYFERERISTFDPTAEFTFNMLAAMAQEESRAISQRVQWGLQKRAEQGIRRLGNGRIFGYDELDGVLTPNSDAAIVKRVFELYAEGKTSLMIEPILLEEYNIKVADRYIRRMLRNEVYVGDRAIQKNPPKNYITKKPDKNAEYDSYYVFDSHEGIISRELWDTVQQKLDTPRKNSRSHFMFGVVHCALCGSRMSRKYMPLKGEKVAIWKCSLGMNDKSLCPKKYIKEEDLMDGIRKQMRWSLFYEKAFIDKIERVDVGEDIKITKKK